MPEARPPSVVSLAFAAATAAPVLVLLAVVRTAEAYCWVGGELELQLEIELAEGRRETEEGQEGGRNQVLEVRKEKSQREDKKKKTKRKRKRIVRFSRTILRSRRISDCFLFPFFSNSAAQWVSIGANISNFPATQPLALVFHGTLGAILVLYALYWLRLVCTLQDQTDGARRCQRGEMVTRDPHNMADE